MKLFADSGCDLPLHFFEKHQVTLIPLHVHLYGEDYEDIKGIDPKEVYQAIRQGEMPKTSQISPLLLEKLFTELAESGEPGIYPAFSSALSGTYQTAVMVRDQVKEKYADLDLTIIDTKAASLGYGLIIMQAADCLQKGWPKEKSYRILNSIASTWSIFSPLRILVTLPKAEGSPTELLGLAGY